jgi:hypothetical protein
MKIKLIGITRVAKEHGLIVQAIKLNDRNYITGQGIIPGNPDTADGLTFDEMTGRAKLSVEKLTKYPVIINPLRQYKFKNGHTFDTDTAVGRDMYNFVRYVSSGMVAESKDKIIRGQHKFYFENKIKESKAKFDKYSKSIEAGIKLQKLSQSEFLDVANYLFIYHNEMRCNPNQEYDIISATLYEYAHEKPAIILLALSKDKLLDIKVSKFVSKGIITRKNGEFYEGNLFIAGSFDHLVEIYRTDITKSNRWDDKLKRLNSNIHTSFDSPELNYDHTKADLLEAVISKDVKKYNSLAKLIFKSHDDRLMELLKKYKLEEEVVEEKPISATDLLESMANENWFTFFTKFQKSFPESELTKKDEIVKFLKGE